MLFSAKRAKGFLVQAISDQHQGSAKGTLNISVDFLSEWDKEQLLENHKIVLPCNSVSITVYIPFIY